MQEIKIPEGCKASIDFEKRVVVIEKEFIPNDGDIIYCEYLDGDINVSWVALVKKVRHFEEKKIYIDNHALYMICTNDKSKDAPYLEIGSDQSAGADVRIATPSEQQLLFDALAKEGKKWNATTLQIEDIEKDILVPENIGIYRCKEDFGVDGDGLYISFNDNTQLLYYNSKYKVWGGCPLHSGYKKVQCKLTQCKREDLKAGDTAVMYQSCITKPNLDVINRYYKVLPSDKYAKVNGESVSVVTIEGKYNFYKVEPINK